MQGHRFTYAANISIMFTEHEFLRRPAAARDAGFTKIEMWWPFSEPVAEVGEIDRLIAAVEEADVQLVGLNFFAGDMPAGQRGIANRPSDRADLAANTGQLIMIAERTGCRKFNLLYGQLDDRWTPAEQSATALDALRDAAAEVAKIDGTVLLEPLARGLNGAYPLTTADEVAQVITEVAAPAGNVGLLFDLFHLGSNGADLIADAHKHADLIRHVQVADSPGRGEPGSGSLPIAAALDALPTDYDGVIACEYRPTTQTEHTLGWIPEIDPR